MNKLDLDKVIEILKRFNICTFGDKSYDGIQFNLGDVANIIEELRKKSDIVRCKDCIYWKNEKERYNQPAWLPCMEVKTGGKWFCADGVKENTLCQTN